MKQHAAAVLHDPALEALEEDLRIREERNTSTRDKLAQFRERLKVLSVENKLMESWYIRLQQRGETSNSKKAEAKRAAQAVSGGSQPSPRQKEARGTEVSEKENSSFALTLEQKYAVCTSEIEDVTRETQSINRASETTLKLIKALADDSEIEIAEVRRDAFEFRRDVVVNGEDARSGHTIAEKLLKWLEDRLARKDIYATKLKLQLHHLKQQMKVPARRLKDRQEVGGDLHYIDFHQLQIENEQFAAKIEEANKEVLKQKGICAKTLEHQVQMKQALQLCAEEAKRLQSQIKERKTLLSKAKVDVQRAVKEKEASRNENKKLHVQSRANLQAPQILDYVNNKAEEYNMQEEVKNWRRKVEVAELEVMGRNAPRAP